MGELDVRELRFADATGGELPPLCVLAGAKVHHSFPRPRGMPGGEGFASQIDALALSHADAKVVLPAAPPADGGGGPPDAFKAYVGARGSVLPTDLLLRPGLNVNGARPFNELGKAACIIDMFARCAPALERAHYRAWSLQKREAVEALRYPCPLRCLFLRLSCSCVSPLASPC